MNQIASNPKLAQLQDIFQALCNGGDAEALIEAFDAECESLAQEDVAQVLRQINKQGLAYQNNPRVKAFYYDVVEPKLSTGIINGFPPGHPVRVYLEENRMLRSLFTRISKLDPERDSDDFKTLFNDICEVEKHYQRKENQLFPCLEKHGWDGPSKNMWAFHDEIRAMLKQVRLALEEDRLEKVGVNFSLVKDEMLRLIAVEEERLLPNALNLLEESEWEAMRTGDEEIGWMQDITPPPYPAPSKKQREGEEEKSEDADNNYVHPSQAKPDENPSFASDDQFHYDEGYMTPQQVNLIFRTLPLDITYVDENDRVVFYNRGDERLFPRSAGVIGREVRYCHPPKSVDTVLRILEEFRKGTRDVADFRINYKGRLVQIRYFAVRDEDRTYRGVLEMSQDITDIKTLEGEQRLLDWD